MQRKESTMRNNKKKIWTVALMCAFTSGCTGIQKNTVTVATDEAYTKQQIVAENSEATSTPNLSEATTESEEYAEQQLQKVHLTLLDAWTTDDPNNHFVEQFSYQRKIKGEEETSPTATTYIILMEYPDMDDEWVSDHLPEIEPLKTDGSEYDWTEQVVRYYGQSYGGQSCIVVCTVDEATPSETVSVQIKDSILDNVFVKGVATADLEKGYEYAKTIFYQPDSMIYIKDRWYIMTLDWKSASGSGYHEGKNYRYVDYSTEYTPISAGLDAVLTSDDVDVTIDSQYDTELYSSEVYVNDSDICYHKSEEYITKITQRIVLDEDIAKQRYGDDIDWDQIADEEWQIRKATVMSCQGQEFWKITEHD